MRFPASILDRLTQRGAVELWVNPKVPQPVPYQYGIFGLLGSYYGHGGEPTDWNIGLFWGDTVTFQGLVGGIRFDGSLARTPDEPRQFVATPLVPFHAAISWDIAGIDGTADRVRVYRNDAVVGSTTNSWNPNGTQRGNIILETTADSGGADKFIVDNIKIWNYAKTDFSDRFVEAPVYALWLSTEPVSGTVTSNSSMPVEVTLDATGLQPDTYTTTLVIWSNDPVTPSVSVPVTMTVLLTADMGRVTGSVSDAWTGQPLTATVELVGVYSMTASPGYTIRAPAGVYSLTAYTTGYYTTTRSVIITAGGLVTENLALEPAQPRLEWAPAAVTAMAVRGSRVTRTLTISNTGPLPLDVALYEINPATALVVAQQQNGGKMVVVASEDFIDGYINNDDNRRLANNILAWLARPTYGDVPWLSETPGAGAIPGHASLPVALRFDASTLLPGEYRATLAIEHNDPAQPFPVEVPVTLMVSRPKLIFPLILKHAPGSPGRSD